MKITCPCDWGHTEAFFTDSDNNLHESNQIYMSTVSDDQTIHKVNLVKQVQVWFNATEFSNEIYTQVE